MQAVLFGITAALGWGAGDFTGGMVSRRVGAISATLYVQALGLLPVLGIAWFTGQLSMSAEDWVWCSYAGAIGSLGFAALYRALAEGRMALAAPVAAIIAASLPVMVGLIKDGLPGGWTLVGFGLALVAIWLVSQTGTRLVSDKVGLKTLMLPILSGLGLGAYLVLVNRGRQTSLLAPLVAVRAAGAIT